MLSNGTPLWLQDSAWSHALRGFLERWSGPELTRTCGTDDASQRRYRDSLASAGYDVSTSTMEYSDRLNLEQLVGGVYSALPVGELPVQRTVFAEQVRFAPGTAPAVHRARPRRDADRPDRVADPPAASPRENDGLRLVSPDGARGEGRHAADPAGRTQLDPGRRPAPSATTLASPSASSVDPGNESLLRALAAAAF